MLSPLCSLVISVPDPLNIIHGPLFVFAEDKSYSFRNEILSEIEDGDHERNLKMSEMDPDIISEGKITSKGLTG